jgi:signal transduction histidine kinase
MQRQLDRMTRLLQELIELTRMESAGSEADYEFVSVVGLMETIHKEFTGSSDAPELQLELMTHAGLLGNESDEARTRLP